MWKAKLKRISHRCKRISRQKLGCCKFVNGFKVSCKQFKTYYRLTKYKLGKKIVSWWRGRVIG